MLTVNDLSMQFGSSVLFSKVDLQFVAGNCYGIIQDPLRRAGAHLRLRGAGTQTPHVRSEAEPEPL